MARWGCGYSNGKRVTVCADHKGKPAKKRTK